MQDLFLNYYHRDTCFCQTFVFDKNRIVNFHKQSYIYFYCEAFVCFNLDGTAITKCIWGSDFKHDGIYVETAIGSRNQ